jgi:hypothetical protein
MPLHDWTRVEPKDYHHFHGRWIFALADALNLGGLPPGYFALADHTDPPFVPDVVTLEVPDDRPGPAPGGGGTAVATAPVPPATATAAGKKRRAAGRRRVVVQQVRKRGRRTVAVIEVVSPSNKAKKAEFADLVGKTVQLLLHGVHVLLIDPFPPSRRDPHGLHAAVWKDLTGQRYTPPAGKPLTFASYVALGRNTFSAFVEPAAVGDPVPDRPLFLTPELHVVAPLAATYETAWNGYPEFLRAAVEGR